MKYSEEKIEKIYKDNLDLAKDSLKKLPVSSGKEISLRGLNGWVYEQTIQFCLIEELELLSSGPFDVEEQFKIKGRAKADLLVGNTAIEIKAGGIFGNESEKYKKYKAILNESGYSYLYITKQETHAPYRKAIQEAFGEKCCFFLSDKNSWRDFVNAVIPANKTNVTND